VIIDEIKRLAAGGVEAIDVVDSLEEQRLRSKASLSQVINALKAESRALLLLVIFEAGYLLGRIIE
jgi:hypothetical protein